MSTSSEREWLSSTGVRYLRVILALAFAIAFAIVFGLTLAQVRLWRISITEALPALAGVGLAVTLSMAALVPALTAREVWITHGGIELERNGMRVSIPWRNVSVCRTLLTDPVFGYRALAFDCWVDERLERVLFIPVADAEEAIEYFRFGGSNDEDAYEDVVRVPVNSKPARRRRLLLQSPDQ